MTPFASVAMLEKFSLLKIAFWSAPALSSASSRRTLVTTSTVPAASSGMAGSWYCADMYQPPSGCKTYRGFSSTPPAFAGGYRLGGYCKPRVRRTSIWRSLMPAPRLHLRFLPQTRSPQEEVHRVPSSLRPADSAGLTAKKLAGNVIDKQLRLGLGGGKPDLRPALTPS